MPGILPTVRMKPTKINPKILVLYGMPKVGKTDLLTKLSQCLIADTEKGADAGTSMRVPITGINQVIVKDKDGNITQMGLVELYNEIVAIGQDQAAKGLPVTFPYKWIALDTLDKLEDYCEIEATIRYKASIIGSKFTGNSVLDLPNGAGYYHVRNVMLEMIEMMSRVCKYLILITHIKEKLLDKGGVNVSSTDISLTGKLSAMVCAKADAIGYIYRNPKHEIMVSFETNESAIMGSRFQRLAGLRIPFDWTKIYIDEPDMLVAEDV